MPCYIRIKTREGTVLIHEGTLKKSLENMGWTVTGSGNVLSVKSPGGSFTLERKNENEAYQAVDAPVGAVGDMNVAYRQVQVKSWAKTKGFVVTETPAQQQMVIKLKKY